MARRCVLAGEGWASGEWPSFGSLPNLGIYSWAGFGKSELVSGGFLINCSASGFSCISIALSSGLIWRG